MAGSRILIVDDDSALRMLLRKHFRDAGYHVEEAEDGERALDRIQSGEFDLVVLDLHLPKLGGMEVCRRIRAHDSFIPILMLTAKQDESDRILGLELGADDYLTKPFNVRELLARIYAILRRATLQSNRSSSEGPEKSLLSIGGLTLDPVRREVIRDGSKISVSNMEFELLMYLAERPGKAFSREQILEEVWGYSAVEYAQNVSTHVNRLRKKLEPNPESPIYVKTVRGFGYAFAEADDFKRPYG